MVVAGSISIPPHAPQPLLLPLAVRLNTPNTTCYVLSAAGNEIASGFEQHPLLLLLLLLLRFSGGCGSGGGCASRCAGAVLLLPPLAVRLNTPNTTRPSHSPSPALVPS